MPSKTPTKQQSPSKDTPVKSATQKEQIISANKSGSKSLTPQSHKKNINLVQDITTSFLSSSEDLMPTKDLNMNLTKILNSQGIQQATSELALLVKVFNYKKETIQSVVRRLDSQNISGLIYLVEQLIGSEQNQKVDGLNLTVWIAVLSKVHPDLVLYNESLKNFLSKVSINNKRKCEQISALRGKISLLTQF